MTGWQRRRYPPLLEWATPSDIADGGLASAKTVLAKPSMWMGGEIPAKKSGSAFEVI